MSVARIPGQPAPSNLISTGVTGLDDVLGGGLTTGRLYLIEGTPGTGKTTIAMQFLLDGAAKGESVLYITLSETESEMKGVASSHGWNLDGIHIRELLPSQETLHPDEQYTMFHPSEVELSETTQKILADVDVLKPTRVVFDSLSELQLLSGNALRYRRQILALKQFFAGRACTVVLLDDRTATNHDLQVQSIAHAVVRLEQLNSDYGAARRRLVVVKYRGRDFRGGFHDRGRAQGGEDIQGRDAGEMACRGREGLPQAVRRSRCRPRGLPQRDHLAKPGATQIAVGEHQGGNQAIGPHAGGRPVGGVVRDGDRIGEPRAQAAQACIEERRHRRAR